ncbi:MAG: hypothetical protein OXI64_00870 [Defluviicoccus sp.]|nr:hypothetical protein [Defluviicoccus sp.]MDE0333482.1 hypothetical protein [Defluviicoccus sp.]
MKRSVRGFVAAAALAGGWMLAVLDARADAIDGMWCRDSRSMRIDGPSIVTPGGTSMTGDYDRHGFQYVVPPGETGAGKTVVMVLLSDFDLDVTVGEGPVERWRRCKLTS